MMPNSSEGQEGLSNNVFVAEGEEEVESLAEIKRRGGVHGCQRGWRKFEPIDDGHRCANHMRNFRGTPRRDTLADLTC